MSKLKAILTKEIFYYLYAVVLCCFILYFVLQLQSADFRIPFDYHWDTLSTGASIKGMIDNGWYTASHLTGAPYGFLSYDFSSNVNLDMGIMKVISLIFPNWALTMNLYFLLTFPLVTISSLFVFRKLKVSILPAIVGSLLFTFIPYHFLQGEPHLNLSAYYLIPLLVLVCIWLYEDNFSLKIITNNQDTKTKQTTISNNQVTNKSQKSNLKDQEQRLKIKENIGRKINWKGIGAILICLGTGLTFIYYPFFSGFFLLMAGIGAAIARKKWQPLFNCLILTGVILLVVVAFDVPSLLYQHQNGVNQVLTRNPADSEIWGLKIIQLLLPVSQNGNPFLAALADKYTYSSIFVNENASASLGIIGSIGFVILIVWLFYRVFSARAAKFSDTMSKINQLSALNGAAVLLGTIGGLGTIIAYLVFPEIRTYTRISIFIAFFCIMAVVLFIDYLIRKSTFSRIVTGSLLVALLFVGITDQTSIAFVPDYSGIKAEYLNDDNFVKKIEKTYPNDNMVFQLPYVAFPEGAPSNNMQYYDLFRGYLHSTDISWSYGTMKGRYGDFWESNIAAKPADEMVKELSFSGFDGIYIDTFGYSDGGLEILNSLSTILNVTPIVSGNGRLVFLDMTGYDAGLKSQYTPEEYETQKLYALEPLYTEFQGGFLSQAVIQQSNLQLSASEGELVVTNLMDIDRTVTISATFMTEAAGDSTLSIESSHGIQNLTINNAGYDYSGDFVIPPGKSVIKLVCDAKPVYESPYQKKLVFAMFSFKVEEHD